MHAVLTTFMLVGLSEMGDKTQLLAFSLAARFRKPWPILAGIFVATLVNHGLASTVGAWVAAHIAPRVMTLTLAISFAAFGIWVLLPDRLEESGEEGERRWGPFLSTVGLFFIAEMGDKTQFATMALAAHFQDPVNVLIGSTAGMLVADGLAIWLGDALSHKLAGTRWLAWVSAALFFLFSAITFVAYFQGGVSR